MEATSLVNPSSFGTLSLSHHGSNSNYYSSFQVRKVLSVRAHLQNHFFDNMKLLVTYDIVIILVGK